MNNTSYTFNSLIVTSATNSAAEITMIIDDKTPYLLRPKKTPNILLVSMDPATGNEQQHISGQSECVENNKTDMGTENNSNTELIITTLDTEYNITADTN